MVGASQKGLYSLSNWHFALHTRVRLFSMLRNRGPKTETQTPSQKTKTKKPKPKPIQFNSNPKSSRVCVSSLLLAEISVAVLPQEFEIWSIINIHFYLRNAATNGASSPHFLLLLDTVFERGQGRWRAACQSVLTHIFCWPICLLWFMQ